MIDFTAILLDLDGAPIVMEPATYKHVDGRPYIGDDGKPVVVLPAKHATLGAVCRNVLAMRFQDEQSLSGDEMMKRYAIALKTMDSGATFAAEEIVLIKKLLAKHYPPIVIGPAYPLLDPPSVPAEKRGNGAVDHHTALDISDDGRVKAIR